MATQSWTKNEKLQPKNQFLAIIGKLSAIIGKAHITLNIKDYDI